MSADFPRSPKFLKGALVAFGAQTPIPTGIIVFQYNPETMTRSFERQTAERDDWWSAGDSGRVQLPPVESFQLSVDLDAVDQLEAGNPLAMGTGLHGALAALELLLYPSSTVLLLNKALAKAGISAITPAKLPVVLFVWGLERVVPVRVTSVSITEQAFDQMLNPIQAKVDLGMSALTQKELTAAGTPFDTLAMVQQIGREVLSKTVSVSGADQIRSLLPF